MSADKPTFAVLDPRRPALWLFLTGHLIIGMTGAIATRPLSPHFPSTLAAILFGIVFSQTSLLGIWGGLGRSRWWIRLSGVVVGVGYLFLLLGHGVNELSIDTFIVIVTATTSVATLLLVIRFSKFALHLSSPPVTTASRIQFSIRHLLILTSLTACLMTIGRSIQPYLPSHESFLRLLPYGLTLGTAGLVPVWFVLVSKHPILFGGGSMAVGACAGFSFGWFNDHAVFWAIVTAIEALGVVVSLWVVRCCGYRHAVPNCESHC